MKAYNIPAPVFEGIVRYLTTRPWGEVADAMTHLQPIMAKGPEDSTPSDLLANAIRSGQVSPSAVAEHAEAGEYVPGGQE
jgi:hypothetical protein